MNRFCRFINFALFVAFIPIQAHAQTSADSHSLDAQLAEIRSTLKDLKGEISEIKESVLTIKRAFDEAREKKTPVRKETVKLDRSSEDDFTLGRLDAPVTIMEFFDFQCGFCAKFHKTTFNQIKKDYIDTGKVRFVFRNYVLSMHLMAAQAASMATCAQKQGKYMEMHQVLFDNPELLGEAKFEELTRKVPGIDVAKVEECLNRPEYVVDLNEEGAVPSQNLAADMREAEKIGVMGTPAFFIGKTVAPGEEMSGTFIRGDQDFSVFKNAIAEFLN